MTYHLFMFISFLASIGATYMFGPIVGAFVWFILMVGVYHEDEDGQ